MSKNGPPTPKPLTPGHLWQDVPKIGKPATSTQAGKGK